MKTPEIPEKFAARVARFPAVLQRLIAAELAVGNEILAVTVGFPAPPVGDCVRLGRMVSSRRRESQGDLVFYQRNGSDYSGEFTDARRFYFVLEPPLPPPPEPDMNAIRAALALRQPDSPSREDSRPQSRDNTSAHPTEAPIAPSSYAGDCSPQVKAFRKSMELDYEKWREGTSYDLELLKQATPEDLVQIENLLLSQPVDDWRDVEALAAIRSPRAQAALKQVLQSADHRVRLAVGSFAPELVSVDERTASLVAALQDAETYGGLTQALLEVEVFHPPAVIDALLRGVLHRSEGSPVHFAGMLMFLHGQAKSAFDWDQRPFFLKFLTRDPEEKKVLFQELCKKIGVSPVPYLNPNSSESGFRPGRAARGGIW